MDTLTKSCSPTIVITANGEMQTHEEATVHVKELDIFFTMKVSKTRQQYCRSESFAMKTDILMNGSTVKNHISFKTGFGFLATRRTSFLLWFQACQIRLLDLTHQLRGHFQDRRVIAQHLLPARLHHLQQVILRLENERIELRVTSLQYPCQLRLMRDQGDPIQTKPIKIQNQKKRATERTGRPIVERTERQVVF